MERYFLLGLVLIALIAVLYWNYETEYEKECKKEMIFEMYIVYKGENITSYMYNIHSLPLIKYYQKNVGKIKYITLKYIEYKDVNVLE